MSKEEKERKKKAFMDKLAKEVKRARADYQPKITQEELAKRIGVSKQHISNLETGKYYPAVEVMLEIAFETGKDLVILFR